MSTVLINTLFGQIQILVSYWDIYIYIYAHANCLNTYPHLDKSISILTVQTDIVGTKLFPHQLFRYLVGTTLFHGNYSDTLLKQSYSHTKCSNKYCIVS